MDRKVTMALVLVVVAAVAVAAAFALGGSEDTEEKVPDTVTAEVWFDPGDGSEPLSSNGTGNSIESILDDALKTHSIEYRSNGTVKSVDGKENTDDSVWTVFRWSSPFGWEVFKDKPSTYVDGMNITLRYADRYTDPEGVAGYTAPDIDVEYKVYFFLQMKDELDSTYWLNDLPLSEEDKKAGLWISGTGCNVNEALVDAMLTNFYPDSEVTCEGGTGADGSSTKHYIVDGYRQFMEYRTVPEQYGWLDYFLGWTDKQVTQEGEESWGGTWTFWVQYNYSPDAKTLDDKIYWEFDNSSLGLYDITEYRYFGLVLKTSQMEDPNPDLPTPSEIPSGL